MIRLALGLLTIAVTASVGFLFLWHPAVYVAKPSAEGDYYSRSSKMDPAPLIVPPSERRSTELVSWVDGKPIEDWDQEIEKREAAISAYLTDTDPKNAETYGFREGQNPALAWDWFENSPVGFSGLPFVLLKTILDLDVDHPDPALRRIARIWKQPAPDFLGSNNGKLTLDHIGLGPHPEEYENGIAPDAASVKSPLPYGMAWENPGRFEPMSATAKAWYDVRLALKRHFPTGSLLLSQLLYRAHVDNWELDRPNFGTPGQLDRVHFSCAACHVGRVVVDGRMKFLPGMPNTEVDPQNYSRLIMETTSELLVSGFDPDSSDPANPDEIVPNTTAVKALYLEMIDKARLRPDTFYGSSPENIARAKFQVFEVADKFPSIVGEFVALGVSTHFVYRFAEGLNAYKDGEPSIFKNRIGQMDAFGVASGLVALHALRPDNSFIEFIRRDNPQSPFFTGFSVENGMPSDVPGMIDPVVDQAQVADRIVTSIKEWAPSVPGPSDIRSLNWGADNVHANWDGNQAASSRSLASGASATGDPRKVNVRIHEPLNPFINYLPPSPYPFSSVDLERAKQGLSIFNDRCASCHFSGNGTIYAASSIEVDPNRSLVITSVSRSGLAAYVLEACRIYGLNNKGKEGADWCMPSGDWHEREDQIFRDTPRRVHAETNGYTADPLFGIWAQAPFLHNGSVPTLGQLLCPDTRPDLFLRGNLHFDEALVGFEWAHAPESRYSAADTINVREYDTRSPGNANGGHMFGSELCPSTAGLDPVEDRDEITRLILNSSIGDLLAYLKIR